MSAVIIIPARQGSTRFPNKPMATIQGKKLLERTWQIAKAVKNIDHVFIATDSEEIKQFAESFGAKTIMTRKECENGTMRVFEAIQTLPFPVDIAINLQGDAVLTPPWAIQAVVDEIRNDKTIEIATPATQFTWEQFDEFMKSKTNGRVSGTMVVFDKNKNALYFSKGAIPFVRERSQTSPPLFRHIGLYAYRSKTLLKYSTLVPTPLEEMEKLEQLRALENGIPIRIVPVDYRGRTHWSIDNPEDVKIAEEIIKKEGELIS